MLNFKEKS